MDYYERQKAEQIASFGTEARIEAGIVRWNSNNAVPFDDVLSLFEGAGLITAAQRAASNEARGIESAAAIAQYRAMREQVGYSEENKAEIRNAFGDRAHEVIDVFTGKRILG